MTQKYLAPIHAVAILGTVVGCSSDGSNSGGGAGGTAGAPGSGGNVIATGGISSAGGSAGAAGGGIPSAAGGAAGRSPIGSGGVGPGGMSGLAGAEAGGAGGAAIGGAGGAPAGGAGGLGSGGEGTGGMDAAAGAGGQASGDVPSAGCGKGGRPSSTNVPNTIVSFPDSYDGSQPMPLLFGLHGASRTNEQFRTVDARTQGTDIERNFVAAYVKSAGSGWVVGTDRGRIDLAYNEITSNYCIDLSRVFATGHSSGAQMIVQLLCAGEDRFRAVAPVASSKYCNGWGPVPALVIHGANDNQRPGDNAGLVDLEPYRTSNQCDMASSPSATAGCTSGSTQVNPGCVEYAGCSVPTLWCQHNDPNYSGTNHGWPCFANAKIFEFLSGF